MKSIPPYDTGAVDCVRNTDARDVYVDPDNATIRAVSTSLAAGHFDVLAYAKAAGEDVASHYQYLNPNTLEASAAPSRGWSSKSELFNLVRPNAAH